MLPQYMPHATVAAFGHRRTIANIRYQVVAILAWLPHPHVAHGMTP